MVQLSVSPTRSASIAIIGAGPAGLMAADVLSQAGFTPTVVDAKPSAGRKFLQAGRGGLNLTYDEDIMHFCAHYFEAEPFVTPSLQNFSPASLRLWAKELGFETFVGSSGKVYPVDKKAAPLLRAWLQRLKTNKTEFKMKHTLVEWSEDSWLFETPSGIEEYRFDAVIMAFGGASWPRLGSTGKWAEILKQKDIILAPFKPSNMGFNVKWSAVFKEKFAGEPLKNITLFGQLGELLISENGVQGSLIYTHSKRIREELEKSAPHTINIDLFPHQTQMQLEKKLSAKRGKLTLSAFWKRQGLSGVKASLLREVLRKEDLTAPTLVSKILKNFPLELESPRPLEEAISTAGGVKFENLDGSFMLKKYPNIYCVGEMLDWEAPTGGYLLTAVMAQGKQAGEDLLKRLQA